jgi:monoamine oxidase
MSAVLQSRFGDRFSFEFGFDQAMMMWQPVGGMDRISAALADAVGRNRITYNAWVTDIRNTTSGVEISYRSSASNRTQVVRADYCVASSDTQSVSLSRATTPAHPGPARDWKWDHRWPLGRCRPGRATFARRAQPLTSRG